MRSDVILLVSEDPEAHGVFERPSETERMVYCKVRSVGYTEYYKALANGIEPSFVFSLADAAEYQGEKVAIYQGRRYEIIRSYTEGRGIELTVEEATVDARKA